VGGGRRVEWLQKQLETGEMRSVGRRKGKGNAAGRVVGTGREGRAAGG
jgi:hypothetical protein